MSLFQEATGGWPPLQWEHKSREGVILGPVEGNPRMVTKENIKGNPGTNGTEHTAPIRTGSGLQENTHRKELLDYLMHLKYVFKRLIDSKESKKLEKEKIPTAAVYILKYKRYSTVAKAIFMWSQNYKNE